MKVKKDYILRQVAGTWVVLPIGSATVDFNGMLNLNEAGALLWEALKDGADRETLADVLTSEYDVERSRALNDVDEFLEKLRGVNCLED